MNSEWHMSKRIFGVRDKRNELTKSHFWGLCLQQYLFILYTITMNKYFKRQFREYFKIQSRRENEQCLSYIVHKFAATVQNRKIIFSVLWNCFQSSYFWNKVNSITVSNFDNEIYLALLCITIKYKRCHIEMINTKYSIFFNNYKRKMFHFISNMIFYWFYEMNKKTILTQVTK